MAGFDVGNMLYSMVWYGTALEGANEMKKKGLVHEMLSWLHYCGRKTSFHIQFKIENFEDFAMGEAVLYGINMYFMVWDSSENYSWKAFKVTPERKISFHIQFKIENFEDSAIGEAVLYFIR